MAEALPKLLRGLLEVFVLERLEREPRHGYALLRDAAQAFGAAPNRNRLYPLLGRLVRDGLVEEADGGGDARTLYRLTDLGRRELQAYRDASPAFRETIARLWGQAQAQAQGNEGTRDEGEGAPTTTIPVRAGGALPYPCPDARVSVERRPATGELTLRVTGCPIGTYSYCPLCPMSKAIAGVSSLVLGS